MAILPHQVIQYNLSKIYPKKVSISFNVSFSTPKTGILKIEVDDREDGFNHGKTSSFLPGASVGLLLYKGPGVTLQSIYTSLGGVDLNGQASVDKEETVVFSAPDDLIKSLNYPLAVIKEQIWLGATLGSFNIEDDQSLRIRTSRTFGIGVCLIKYKSNATIAVLSAPALDYDSYEIGIQVVGRYDPTAS